MRASKWQGVLLAAAFCLGAPAFSQGDDDKPRLPSMRRVAVPGVVGKTWNDAKAILASAGLSYKSSTLVINPGPGAIGHRGGPDGEVAQARPRSATGRRP
jgi:hypothetical protein